MPPFLRRYLPDPQHVREHKSLRFLGERLHDPWLWHFNRRATVRGLAVGAFYAFVPFRWQMLLAAITAFWPVSYTHLDVYKSQAQTDRVCSLRPL